MIYLDLNANKPTNAFAKANYEYEDGRLRPSALPLRTVPGQAS